MGFCGNCGAQTQVGIKFCPACGTSVASATAGPQGASNQGAVNVDGAEQAGVSSIDEPVQAQGAATGASPIYTPPVVPGAPTQASIQDAQDGKVMSIIAYILFFIPLLTGAHKTSPFVKYHTNQGTVLFIAALCWSVAYGILSFVLAFIPMVGWVAIMILGFTGFVFLILVIVGIINVVNGRMNPLPVIGKITIVK